MRSDVQTENHVNITKIIKKIEKQKQENSKKDISSETTRKLYFNFHLF